MLSVLLCGQGEGQVHLINSLPGTPMSIALGPKLSPLMLDFYCQNPDGPEQTRMSEFLYFQVHIYLETSEARSPGFQCQQCSMNDNYYHHSLFTFFPP